MTAMIRKTYSIHFNTPAFLGDAEQKAMWRTPPFKTLIRQWWRVAVAQEVDYDVNRLREQEAQLFGSAADKKKENSGQSKLKIRLSHWKEGSMKNWPEHGFGRINQQVRADVYLGFGAIAAKSKKLNIQKEQLAHECAIAPKKESAELCLMFPQQYEKELHKTMQLIAWFGTLGGRSRNGWGSLHLTEKEQTSISEFPHRTSFLQKMNLPLESCLKHEWVHALGTDHQGLLMWKSQQPVNSWKEGVNFLANRLFEIRQSAKQFKGGEIKGGHLLGYPLTKQSISSWDRNTSARLPSQLRFKLIQEGNQLTPVLFHLPCTLPHDFKQQLSQREQHWLEQNEIKVWQSVHQTLDHTQALTRIGGNL